MTIVVKIGGAALEDALTLRKCTRAIAELSQEGHRVAVVHGGGGALTRTLHQMGKTSEFVNGLRVTDAETRDVALMVLVGMVNKKLVAAMQSVGLSAIGLCGGDGMAFRARKKHVPDCDLGYVGEICCTDPAWIEMIWQKHSVPVVACMALGADGEYYNINADQMAASCAISCKADALIFLTDVPGVRNAEGNVISRLNTTQAANLSATRVVSGGMLPKLQACGEALKHGVRRVKILPAAEADVLTQLYFTKLNCGTEVARI